MFDTSQPIALILRDENEINSFSKSLKTKGFNNLTAFTSTKEAYEVAIRKQFPFFITRIEMNDMNGLVFIQKIRETGNYGLETHLIVSDMIDTPKLNILFEHDLSYVIVPKIKEHKEKTYIYIPPLNQQDIDAKIDYILDSENNISETEELYRSAKSAYIANIFDMRESLIEKIVNINKMYEKAYILKGNLHIKKELYDIAIDCFRIALQINPKSSVASYKLAVCEIKKGEYKKSADLLNKIASLNCYNIKLLENAGLSNFKIDNIEKAQEHTDQLLKIDSENINGAMLKADILVKKGNIEDVSEVLSKTHSQSEIIKYLNKTGVEYLRNQRPTDALKIYKLCLEKYPESNFLHVILFNKGLSYLHLDNKEKAKEHFEKALVYKPDFDKALEVLKSL